MRVKENSNLVFQVIQTVIMVCGCIFTAFMLWGQINAHFATLDTNVINLQKDVSEIKETLSYKLSKNKGDI